MPLALSKWVELVGRYSNSQIYSNYAHYNTVALFSSLPHASMPSSAASPRSHPATQSPTIRLVHPPPS